MTRSAFLLRPWMAAAFLAIGLAACRGSTGPAGAAAVDHGSIAGTVNDSTGAPVQAATVKTDPTTVTVQTDHLGHFNLSSIPIGAYTVIASMTGYVDGRLSGVGVGAGGMVNVSLVLAPIPPTTGSLSGTVRGRTGHPAVSSAVPNAQVCVEATSGTPNCATSAADGTYTLSGVAPGFVFVSASKAAGYLDGETRDATFLAAGAAVTGVDVTLSGMPSASATYVGSGGCPGCHTTITSGLVTAWQNSAHVTAVDRALGRLDVAGWPAAATNCTAPNTRDTGFTAPDPAVATAPQDREVFLVRYASTCTPAFAMAFDTNQNGTFDATDTILPVSASVGGVATGAGQCGNGGILPASAPCAASYAAYVPPVPSGWWQQEYLFSISGTSQPTWVTWTPPAGDMLVLPAAWNQRSQAWIPAPDYNPVQAMTWSTACAGCHEAGLSLAFDAGGNVTSYGAAAQNIGCEKCHGPGSSHVGAGGDAQLIVNPAYLTAQSEREVCGQCHSQGVTSTSPSGALGFAWNDQKTVGGGNFIPGVHALTDFLAAPAYGDPDFYWPSGFPSVDHLTYQDVEKNVHANNQFEKITCSSCHGGHGATGGPFEFAKSSAAGNAYVFQNNDAVLRNDVLCLSCHATFGSFASIALEDVANYHVSESGAVLKNGTAISPTPGAEAASTSLIASAVNAHMMATSAMPAYFDPTGAVSGMPVGRCSSCHMAKTAFTGSFFMGTDPRGKAANVIGDVSAHTTKVAWPDMSIATLGAATSWDTVMPNACGSCHTAYLVGF